MKKKSPIFIHEVKFDSFTLDNVPQNDDDLIFFSYSGGDEFQADEDFGGIAAMITIVNTNHRKDPARGTRRRVLLTLFDESEGLIVASRLLRVDIPKTEGIFIVYESFHAHANCLCGGHTYRMALEDTSTERMLGEYYFRLREPEEDGGEALLSAEDLDQALDEFIACRDGDSDETLQPVEREPQPEPLRLENLTGLKAVKDKLAVYERVVRFNRLRADHNLPTSPTPLHAMFLGSPGTGKTTVAKMMGEMLRDAGVLSRGHVVVRERSNLIGIHYNSEGENTLKAIEEAQGGILLIDEAYQLHQPQDARDPGKFVIETLLTVLADPTKNDWMLILAGYPDEMRRLFDMNPGFKSRIPESNIYDFEDFSEPELMEIACKYLARQRFNLSPEAGIALGRRLNADYMQRDRTFGNARHVINLIQTEILPAMAVRVTEAGASDCLALTEIQAVDIPAPAIAAPVRNRVGFAI